MDAEYYKKYEPVFGKWYITKQLGAGSYGKVFEIQRTDALDGTVYRGALKAITIPSSPEELQSVLDEDGLDRQGASSYFRETVVALNREIALMNKVKGHSNIVSYEDHDVIEHTDGIGWDILIRMELLTPISQYFKQFDTIPRQAVLRLGIDLCRALEVCEKYSIIHRDIKPANIFISDTGDFKLGDFGVARTASASTGASTFAGTVNYMAPEVFRREKYTASVDTYSLGLVMYQLLNANRMPFYPPYPQPLTALAKERAHDRRLAGEPLPDPVNASGPLADILRKACAPAPADRFASPTEMRLALEAVLNGASDAAPVPDAGDATVRAAAPAAEVPAADAAATVSAAPKAPETPDAADETTRLPFGQQPAAQPTAPAKAPAPKAEDETVFLFAQQEQQRRPQGGPILRCQVKALHSKIEAYGQAQPLDQENPQPTRRDHRAQVFQPEKIGSLHIEVIPVRKLSLGHALPYQPEKGSILPYLKLQKRCRTPGAGQKEYSRRQHQQNRAGNGSEYRFLTFHSVGAPFPCRNMGLLYLKGLPP